MPDDVGVPADLWPEVAELLSERFGAAVAVEGQERLKSGRTQVVRVHLGGAPVETAICRYGESNEMLWNDLAGMRFLASVPSPPAVVPQFYAGGPIGAGKAVVLSEDIGSSPELSELLLRGTAEQARQGLEGYVDALLDVHLATFGLHAEHAAIRSALQPPRPVYESLTGPQNLWPTLVEGIANLGDDLVPPGATEAVVWVESILQPAGPWWAFSLNDCCPDNNHVLPDGRVKLFDLEFSGCRHALLDLSYVRTFMPTCWCLRRLPAELSDQLVERYRSRLLAARPELPAADFGRQFAACQAFWALAALSGVLATTFTDPKADEGFYFAGVDFSRPSPRDVTYLRLTDLIAAARDCEELTPLGELATTIAGHLEKKWPAIELLPLYPAFSASSAGDSVRD